MINSLLRTDVEAVEDHFALEFVPVLLDVVVLDHDYYHINICKELIKVGELILGNLVVLKEWVVALEWVCKVALLKFKHLKGW